MMPHAVGHRSSRTAEHVALFRALESRRGGARLFVDPYAIRFLRSRYRFIARLAELPLLSGAVPGYIDRRWTSGPRSSAVVRTRLIDDLLGDAVAAGTRQVLLLGAGYDSRAYRIPALAALTVFEVDHPATQAGKRRQIHRRIPPKSYAHVRFVPADFERDDVDAALRWLTIATAAGSHIIFTYVDRGALDNTGGFDGTAQWLATVHGAGEPWKFGLDPSELPGYLADRGMTLISDQSARDAAVRYLEPLGRHEPTAGFYRIAVAQVI